MASNISAVAESPSVAKFATISFVYCRKKRAARSISAGKAILESALSHFAATVAANLCSATPAIMGRSSSTIF